MLQFSCRICKKTFLGQTNDTHVACRCENFRAIVGSDCPGFKAVVTIGSDYL